MKEEKKTTDETSGTEDATKKDDGSAGKSESSFSSENDDIFGSDYEDDTNFPSLDDALNEKFEINDYSTLKQRFKNILLQPRRMADLYPAPLYLLTKRVKRCKTCTK
eukprot:CAMPEP_0176355840 /NCGR_PEP_ID=MMETSP0126-20121128/13581_1 /TAXON_ID=141414 ORGANISM="Strombidinopsis acuminatum, Strain SPMC142" /NCGR_SAMPLE_ID=MMETSP0126 /ASSEMBLY_ACC=CAM_ASM_000229 /LENGTH=106 /DNA_ID=CAMNT_0017708661 /DNA_START=1182 /DNA_END=1502 /DNA_ORIENTATION=-